MMVRDRRDGLTLDLLAWEPPEPSVRFEPSQVRGATLKAKLCRAMAIALDECGKDRDQVAAEMSEYLDETVTKAMLDAYLSEARGNHNINVVRFAALVHATGDFRLLSLIPELFGFAVMDDRYVALIRAQQMRDKAAELARLADAEERRARVPR